MPSCDRQFSYPGDRPHSQVHHAIYDRPFADSPKGDRPFNFSIPVKEAISLMQRIGDRISFTNVGFRCLNPTYEATKTRVLLACPSHFIF